MVEGAYSGGDLIIVGRLALVDPDAPQVIQAGALPGYVIGLLAAAGVGLVGLLLVKILNSWSWRYRI